MDPMKYKSFLILINQLNVAYKGKGAITDEAEIRLYCEAFDDLTLDAFQHVVIEAIKHEIWFPTIAGLRKHLKNFNYHWSIPWIAFINGAKSYELNQAAQYAISILSRTYLENLIYQGKQGVAAEKFKELYEEFYLESMGNQLAKTRLDKYCFKDKPAGSIEEKVDETVDYGWDSIKTDEE